MGEVNQTPLFDSRVVQLVRDQLNSLNKSNDDESRLRSSALTRFLEKKKNKDQSKLFESLPYADLMIKQDFVLYHEQKMTRLSGSELDLGENQSYSGILDITEERITVWLQEELIQSGVVFEVVKPAVNGHWGYLTKFVEEIRIEADEEFFDLSIGLFRNLVELYIPKSVIIEKPLMIRLRIQKKSEFFSNIVMIRLSDSAQAKVLLDVQSSCGEKHQNIIPLVMTTKLGENSELEFIESQVLAETDWYLPYEKIEIGKNATFNRFIVDRGSGLNKRYVSIHMNHVEAQARITGVYMADGGQRFIYDTYQNHVASYTQTDLLFKGVLEGKSSALWKGNVYVGKDTHGVDGYQMNNNLLLSESTRAEAIPGLEILSDDVKCSHGVTLSSIDPDQLFYLESRGIAPSTAVDLIKAGFIESAVSRINDPAIKNIALEMIKVDINQIYK